MRRKSHRDDPEAGLAAALKAIAVVLAVGMLALFAGQSAYTSGGGSGASTSYRLLEPARDDVPIMGGDKPATDRIENREQHVMAAAPSGDPAPK